MVKNRKNHWTSKNHQNNEYLHNLIQIITSTLYRHLQQIDCFTIALGKKTCTTFPIIFNNNQNYNALYDTGAGASLINYSAYVSLGQDLDAGYQPLVKNASGEDMGTLGQITCTFTINNQPFTQSFIVCKHMQ